MNVTIRPLEIAERPKWLRMRKALFPECGDAMHVFEMDRHLAKGNDTAGVRRKTVSQVLLLLNPSLPSLPSWGQAPAGAYSAIQRSSAIDQKLSTIAPIYLANRAEWVPSSRG